MSGVDVKFDTIANPNRLPTTLHQAVNVCLSVIGEAPVNSLIGDSLPTQVAIAKQTIEEVGRDVQSKGWWFNTSGNDITLYNTSTSNNFNGQIPEEARRYITIRAARVLQSRFIGNEELHKFSYNEELVSLATLQQAHVRNGGNSTSFTAFPTELKNLGIEEVMFLQGTAEEKLLTLRLGTELKSQAKIDAEKDLLAQQKLTEVQETLKRTAEKDLTNSQKALVDQQAFSEIINRGNVQADTALKGVQASSVVSETNLRDQQKLTEVQETLKRVAERALVSAQEAKTIADTSATLTQEDLISKQALTEAANKLLVDAQKAKVDAEELNVDASTNLLTAQYFTETANKIRVDAETVLTTANATKVNKDADVAIEQKNLLAKQVLTEVAQELLVDAQRLNVIADTTLKNVQSTLITNQAATEVQQALKIVAETSLLGDQEQLVVNQAATELKRALDVAADTTIKGKQGSLIDAQVLTEVQNALKVTAETSLLADQEALVVKQALTEVQRALDIAADITLKGHQSTLVQAQATDVAADTTLKGKQGALVDAQELKTDAETTLITAQELQVDAQTSTEASRKLDIEADTVLKGKQGLLVDAQELKTDAETNLITAQETKTGAEKLLIDAQELKTDQEAALLAQQRSTEVEVTNKTSQEATFITKQGALVDAQELKTDAESALIASQTTTDASQRALIDAQELKTDAEATLIASQTTTDATQRTLIEAQELKTDSEKALLDSQKTQLDTQTALELTEEQSYSNAIQGVPVGTTYRDYASELRMMGVQETNFYALPAYKKKEALKDAIKMRTVSATETGTDAKEIEVVNNIRRMIGEMPITALNGDSMASEAVRMLRKTNKELQGRGWWFNAEYDVSLSPSPDNLGNNTVIYVSSKDSTSFEGYYVRQNSFASGASTSTAQYYIGTNHRIKIQSSGYSGGTVYDIDFVGLNDGTVAAGGNLGSITSSAGSWGQMKWSDISYHSDAQVIGRTVTTGIVTLDTNVLSVEVKDYDTNFRKDGSICYLYDLKDKTSSFTDDLKAKIIYERTLDEMPQKFLEYLEVRVALLLTEMYPRDGIDIQRLPRIERELEAYFRDRENDEGNYNIFDNYDTSARIGINRNYDII